MRTARNSKHHTRKSSSRLSRRKIQQTESTKAEEDKVQKMLSHQKEMSTLKDKYLE